jgi:uncharacterized protein YsxB (DUF464 family)
MIEVTIYKTKGHEYAGFDVEGHSGYADKGQDIVCAAVSMMVINTINSIERLTDDKTSLVQCDERGQINFRFDSYAGHDAHLLVHSMILGLESIQEDIEDSSGDLNSFIDINFKEV